MSYDSDDASMNESIDGRNNDALEAQGEFPEDDQFKILIATDIHLGYKENDSIRGEDTFKTFEEILEVGVASEVDFILLGGDLFHDTKPTPYCINKCIGLLRKYCLGDKPISFEILSDQRINFNHTVNKQVNYEDPNMNVAIPVFSIHGNHDDPTGKNQISAMDLMASTGLINYFGRWENLTKVEINPILLRKGNSLLALYGLSHISDQRLGRLFLEKKVSIAKPGTIDEEQFFNLLVLHQNRAVRGPKNFIPPDAIPKDIDLVMWGHEHDCRITPEKVANIFITQPGSSVATSLAEGESITKKIGILTIYKKNFKIDELELRTVRPFIFDNFNLDFPNVEMEQQLEKSKKAIRNRVDFMIEKAEELNRLPKGSLPLIRLRAHYKHEIQVFNAIKFGQQYVGRVANPEDILKFICTSGTKNKKTVFDKNLDDNALGGPHANRVEDIILRYFEDNKNKLFVLSAKGLTESVVKFIDTNDDDAPQRIMKHQFQKTFEKLKELSPEEDEIDDCLDNLCNMRTQKDEEEFRTVLNNPGVIKTESVIIASDDEAVTISDDDTRDKGIGTSSTTVTPRPTRGRGSRGGKGSRGGRARGSRKKEAA